MTVAEKIEKKREEILEALKRCLLTNVYSQISFNDVAASASMSKGGVRHYFPTKEGLFIALIENFFTQIAREQVNLLKVATQSQDRALLSTMFNIEKFLLNQHNVIILMNIIIYSFEDAKIMEIVRKFLRDHLDTYESIIRDYGGNATSTNDTRQLARSIQVLLLTSGLFQTIDPIDYDTQGLLKTLFKLFGIEHPAAR